MQSNRFIHLLTDLQGRILENFWEEMTAVTESFQNLQEIIAEENYNRFTQFFNEIKQKGYTQNWQLQLKENHTFYFSGIYLDSNCLLWASEDKKDTITILSNLMNTPVAEVKEFSENFLQNFQQENVTSIDEKIFDEYSLINNELTDAHRSISKLNVALKQKNGDLELLHKILRHDLTNAFAVIMSAVKLIRKGKKGDFLEEIIKNAEKGVALIKNMKILASAESKYHLFTSDKIRLHVEKHYPNLKIDFTGNCTFRADENIFSLFDNLITNTIRHGRTNFLKISFHRKKDHTIITVADNGIGIPDNAKEHIFEENFIYGDTGNTGLGLYIVKRNIERYHGSIEVSDNQPTGTKFRIELPSL